MKRILMLAIVGVAAAASAAPAAETLRQQSERTFEGRGLRALRVENARGLVVVRPSTDGTVHLTAIKESQGMSREDGESLAADTRVIAETHGGALEVRVEYPDRDGITVNLWRIFTGDFEVPRFQVKLGIEIPPALDVEVRTTSGDVRTRGVRGGQVIASTSGDVLVQQADGRVRISSTSGDIETEDLGRATLTTVSGDIRSNGTRGALTARTTSGDLRVLDAGDSLAIETVSGDIRVQPAPRGAMVRSSSGGVVMRDAAGGLDVTSVSGEVSLGLVDPLSRVVVATSSGDVVARYEATSGCTLDLNTSSGTIDVELPVELRSTSRRSLRGTVGDGAVAIRLKTASGDIHVRGPRN